MVDEGLSKQQAQQTARNLAGYQFAAIYSSPLRRAKETAEILAGARKKEIIWRNELMEKNFGGLSGQLWEADPRKDRVTYDYKKWGGETSDLVRARVQRWLDAVKNEHHGDVLAVTY